uniref:LanC-like protein 3 n=1 Tax=Wuchereria bancrofti TaxID=6293 RepID=A0AAF5PHE5_WUCBA
MFSKWLPRYMENPFQKNAKKGAESVTKTWLENEARQLLKKIMNRSPSNDDLHGGAYTGGAGIAYAMLKASSSSFNHDREESTKYGKRVLMLHLEAVRKKESNRETCYLLGSLSIYVVCILYGKTNEGNKRLIDRITEIGHLIASGDVLGDGDDELLAGRVGFLAAVMTLREHLAHKTIPDNCVKKVVNKIIASGRSYASSKQFEVPLMYQYHGRHYLGAAHGLMGILQMLLCFVEFLDEKAKSDVLETLDWTVSLQLKNGNIPSKVEEEEVDRGENELVHWCHGATGAVHLMIVAYLRTHNKKYLKSADAALNLIWEKGILMKGPGLCHGAAGSGYAFLLFHRLTNEQRYLDCALCIAKAFCSKDFRGKARTPDRPYSLFEGISGALCFICDLLEPDKAQFPLFREAMFRVMHRRYFDNPYLTISEAESDKVTRQTLKQEAANLVEEIMERRYNMDDYDGGVYVGIAGNGYSVLYASRLLPEKTEQYANFCNKMVEEQLKQIQHSGRRKDEGQYLLGTLGIYVIKAILDYEIKKFVNTTVIDKVKSLVEVICAKDYLPNGADEMLVGRAGFLAAILTLRMRLHHEIISNSHVKKVIDCIINSGRCYAKRHRSRAPLMYQYYNVEYLGAAHGLMGILQMLLSFHDLLDGTALRDIESTLDWLLEIQSKNGNFASSVEEIGMNRESNELLHWCHGATGAVHLMIVAYLSTRKAKFLLAAEKALDLIWEQGVLRKGPGICHGVAGGGYAFLLYYRLTQKAKYFKYAQCFARIACDQNFRKYARIPDSPCSLFEGIGGLLCFLVDVSNPSLAQFPLIPIRFE